MHLSLETKHAATHVFRRRDNRLEVVRIMEGAERIGDQFAVVRTFRTMARVEFLRRRPIMFVASDPAHNLAAQFVEILSCQRET